MCAYRGRASLALGDVADAAACACETESNGFIVLPDLGHLLYKEDTDSAADDETLLTTLAQQPVQSELWFYTECDEPNRV